jgi:transposase-like protein
MKITCPNCKAHFRRSDFTNRQITKFGSFYRTSDRKRVQRYFCKACALHFSVATLFDCYKQKKRHVNQKVARVLAAGVSMRECARVLKLNKKTVVRKLLHMGPRAKARLEELNAKRLKATVVEFDDLETFEHSKCKPVAVSLMVESRSRWILGYEVAQMSAKGVLAVKALKKYGKRRDERTKARRKLFLRVKNYIHPKVLFKTDENPHYTNDIKSFFQQATLVTYKGRKSSLSGQGELKKTVFDPIFSINHTCAVLRYRTSRLIRKTWSTTKKKERLNLHLALVILHHNLSLKSGCLSTA